jgi:hypothetical protein
MTKEVGRLRARLGRMPPGQGRRYGAEVRDWIARVVKQMREGGASWRDVGEALGVPLETVRRICNEREGSRASFVAVEVAPEVRRGAIALVTPGGHRVEGLDVETVAMLLARLA